MGTKRRENGGDGREPRRITPAHGSRKDMVTPSTNTAEQKRLDEARAETDRAFDAANQQANATARQVDSAWEQMRADAKARGAELKAKAKRRSDQFDADVAASDADWAEADAYAALDYADWAVGNARLAILDAIDARAYADERASALV